MNIVAPDTCVSCGTEGSLVCLECADEKMPTIPVAICFLCGKASRNYKVCLKCSGLYKPQFVWVAVRYEALAKELVQTFKFSYKRSGAKFIAEYIDEVLPYFADVPIVSFVPTAPAHIRERGFDHALLITKELCKIRGWHYQNILARTDSTQQHNKKRADRIKQIEGAFRVLSPSAINGRHILLIDDVTTTGATLNECAKMLKKAGASQIDAVVFARTPEKS